MNIIVQCVIIELLKTGGIGMIHINITDEALNTQIEDTYYKIVAMFGKLEYAGCFHLAVAVALYNADCKRLTDLFRTESEIVGSTPAAIERNIRVYLRVILEDKSIKDISEMIGYPLSDIDGTIKAKEFIAALKLYFTVNEDE